MRQIKLTRAQIAEMRGHIEACLPFEACGLLAGSDGTVREVIPVTNQARSPARFRMDSIEQLRAFHRIEARGLELLGIFHSHPGGPRAPSVTDVAEAAYKVVYIIWSRSQDTWEADSFWIEHGLISEVKLSVADGD